nr:RNA-dependent RNA polymerase [Marmot picobirnavirus]
MKMKPSIGKYFKLPNPGLWAYFKHNVSGQPEDFRPPFFNKWDRRIVLQLWQDKLDDMGVKKTYPDLYRFEMDMKSKVGPMSIQAPLKDRIESIENYYTLIEEPGVPISQDAIDATKRFFSRAGGIRLRSKKRVLANMRLSTNSGSPYFTKRRKVVADTLEEFPLLIEDDGIYDYDHNYALCATLGWRGQEGGPKDEDVKQRVVWMMPFSLNIEELSFYQPAIESMQKNGLIPAYVSMDAVDREVTLLFDTKDKHDLVVETDFSKFDQHFNKHLQNAAFEVEDSLLAVDHGTKPRLPYFYVKFQIPLVCSEDLMYTGLHGMGSGSGGTNFDECMAHKCLQFEAAIHSHAQLNPHSMAYGDDGILSYPGITVDQVIQAYTSHGQEMNVTKQYASTHDCVFLRRWHGMDYRVDGVMVGVYSTFRALGRLLAQERYYDPDKWSPTMVTLRALSIIENCKWSPYFKDFIQFVMKGDKYRLGLDIPGFFDDLESIAKEAIESFTDFLGYTKTMQSDNNKESAGGIDSWEVVKYLKSLR